MTLHTIRSGVCISVCNIIDCRIQWFIRLEKMASCSSFLSVELEIPEIYETCACCRVFCVLSQYTEVEQIRSLTLEGFNRQSFSSEAYSLAATQEIPCILWNPKSHYCVHKSRSLVPTIIRMNLLHAIPSCFLNTHFNVILFSEPKYFKWSVSSGFPTKPLYTCLFFQFAAVCPAHLILQDLITLSYLMRIKNRVNFSTCRFILHFMSEILAVEF